MEIPDDVTGEMPEPVNRALWSVVGVGGAVLLWLGLGFSLGWYYTFTYYGRTGIPVPVPEGVLSILLYYFSVINTALWIEAVHWMLVFPVAGVLWAAALNLTAPRFGGTRPGFANTMFQLSLACIPLVIPSPFMAYMAGHTHANGFELDRALAVALRRGNITVPDWLTPLYLTLGILVLAIQFWLCMHLFHTRGFKTIQHFSSSLALAVIAAALLGSILALPLRLTFE